MYDASKGGTSGEEEDLQEILAGSWQSTTPSSKPMTHDKIYYFLPYWDDKPSLHVRSIWPDYRRRMYNSNIIGKIVDKLVSFSDLSNWTITGLAISKKILVSDTNASSSNTPQINHQN